MTVLTPIFNAVILPVWWFWAFVVLLPLFQATWLSWRQELYEHSYDFESTFWELRIPREIKKSPRAMEQVLMAIHSLRNAPGDFGEKWIDGEVTNWFSLEIVSFGGQIHFYVQAPKKRKNIIEAAFLAYYPDVEIVESEDYISRIPENLRDVHAKGMDIWGSEMMLAREAAYPIKTYIDFETMQEEAQFDPMSQFIEILGKLKQGEFTGIQILIQPLDHTWKDKYDHLIESLRNSESGSKSAGKKSSSSVKRTFDFSTFLPVLSTSASSDKDKNKKDDSKMFKSFIMRTPGETDVLKAVEKNLSKPAFNTLIRFVYMSPKASFNDTFPRRGILSAFNQYATVDMNCFVRNEAVSTRVKFWHWPHIFPKTRVEYRKEHILYEYRRRKMPKHTAFGKFSELRAFRSSFTSRTFPMNVECLATIYHPPTFLVLTAPHIKRVESRKVGPPAGLAIFGDEKELEKYQ
jgi:hypothetical protein